MLDAEKISQLVGKWFTVEFVADFMGVAQSTLYKEFSEALRKRRNGCLLNTAHHKRNREG